VITKNIPIETTWMPREEAEKQYGFRLYQGGVVPGREIRVVKSGDWDIEACGGTHLKNTGELGFLKILHTERIQDGVERIIFSVGLPALEVIQKSDNTLSELAKVLNAPQNELVKAAKRFVDEWRKARQEKNRLLAEIARKEAEKRETTKAAETVSFDIVNYINRKFESLDLDRMIKIASELTKKDPKLITVFYGADKKTARIIVMAGKQAVKQGINASQIAKEASQLLGGGGSGRPDFAQGGGTKIEKIPDALKKAEATIKKQAKKTSID
jgi:alanyl-tRNA synthetase